jgi:hypothetical protein
MKKMMAPIFLASSLAMTAAATFAAPSIKQMTIEDGKGVSFQLGMQNGIAVFKQDGAACLLSVSISAVAAPDSMSGMSGMSGGMAGAAVKIAPTMKVHVVPAQPARLSTPDGQELVFNCGPDGKQMFLDMPGDLKTTVK